MADVIRQGRGERRGRSPRADRGIPLPSRTRPRARTRPRRCARPRWPPCRPEFHLRADRFYNAPDTEFDLTEQGGLMWGDQALGKLVKGRRPDENPLPKPSSMTRPGRR